MKYINPNSKSGIVNRLSDFILSNIGEEYKTIIEVVYLGNFFVVKGLTESDKILNLREIIDKFTEKYSYLLFPHNITNINFIDIMSYNHKFTDTTVDFKFFDSEIPRFDFNTINYVKNNIIELNQNYIENNETCLYFSENSGISVLYEKLNSLSISSEFPFGYSLNNGRLKFFYCEYIVNHIVKTSGSDSMVFRLLNNDFKIISDSLVDVSKLESLVLDVFDFNLPKFKNDYVSNLDLEHEIDNQLVIPKWVTKDKIESIILV
jgi:hypothetical protein